MEPVLSFSRNVESAGSALVFEHEMIARLANQTVTLRQSNDRMACLSSARIHRAVLRGASRTDREVIDS